MVGADNSAGLCSDLSLNGVLAMPTISVDLQEGVSGCAYESTKQRVFRVYAFMLLCLRHGARGIILSWPLYFVALIPVLMPIEVGWWALFFVFPAVLVSLVILLKGLSNDYAAVISGKLLKGNEIIKILWWGA